VRKVAELIDYEHLDPEERRLSKNRHAAESAKKVYAEAIERRKQVEIAKNLIQLGIDNALIAKATGLEIETIEALKDFK
jgi:NAD-dependent DNA ligase